MKAILQQQQQQQQRQQQQQQTIPLFCVWFFFVNCLGFEVSFFSVIFVCLFIATLSFKGNNKSSTI